MELTGEEKMSRRKSESGIVDVGPGGRKPRTDIDLEEIKEIMLKYAKGGGFFLELPAAIHAETGITVGHTYLKSIQDASFQATRELCKSYCIAYWTKNLQLASIPTAAWSMVMKNVGDWKDKKDVVIEADVTTKADPDKAKATLEDIKRQLADSL